MKFAKLYDTCKKHQILVRMTVDDGVFSIVFTTLVDEVGMIESEYEFEDSKTALAAFDAINETIAMGQVKELIKDLKGQMASGEVVH